MSPPDDPNASSAGHQSPLLRRPARASRDGSIQRITPADAGWQYISFDAYRLAPGQSMVRPGDGQEVLALVLEGSASLRAGDTSFGTVGGRETVFDGPPATSLLVEPGRDVSIAAQTPALVAVAAAPGGDVRRTALIRPDDVFVEKRGSGNTARTIHRLLWPTDEAGRLIAVEAYTPGGNWSSYPPHKHDTQDPPRESYLEEIYFYRFAKPTGFAVQRVYTPDRSLDETLTATDDDLILVPCGYHVVGAAAGYDTYYLNVMAGPTRLWRFTVDPDHAWLMNWDPDRPQDQGGTQ